VCDPADHTATPVGQTCLWCGETVEAGDQGVVMPTIREGGASMEPLHLECHMRQVVGGVRHIEGRCLCCGGTEEPDPPGVTRREAARRAERAWLLKQRDLVNPTSRHPDRKSLVPKAIIS
jgi:hypothetical protein